MFCGKGWCGKVLGGEGGKSQQTPACCSKGETHLSQPASTNSAGQMLHLHFIRQHQPGPANAPSVFHNGLCQGDLIGVHKCFLWMFAVAVLQDQQ